MSKGKITILGGGNGAHAAAVDFTKQGFEVCIYEEARFASNMESVFKTKQISYTGALGEGVVDVSMVTSNMAEAIRGAKFILVAVPAYVHAHYATAIPSHLENGQIVLVFAATFGSLIFWKEMKKQCPQKDLVVAETYTLPYATRLAGPGKSVIMGLTNPIMTGVMPAKRTAETIAALKAIYPVEAAQSVIDCGLYSMNPVVHAPGCILNAGRIELMQGEFWFYKEGITPAVGRATEELDAERMAIIRALGYTPKSVLESLRAMGSKGKNIFEAITTTEEFVRIKGPDSFKNRYYAEDIPYGLVPWAYVARLVGVKTPIMDALITLANSLLEQDCWKKGRQLEDLGIAGMNKETLLAYLQNG